jgi:DNA (cytosine-5)-methyltransferase 1
MKRSCSANRLSVAALFAGIGGLDVGLEEAGHHTRFLSEFDPAAQSVLRRHFPNACLRGDIREIRSLPKVDMITAGFPCQDISFIGTLKGLSGNKSSMVWEMFRLVARHRPQLVLLENVSNLLRLERGAAMRKVLSELERLGYRWAYRLVDSRGFGLPQRRLRVVILASRGDISPADVLFSKEAEPRFDDSMGTPVPGAMYGFYWTEGSRGVGWAKNAVPTIKGGSGLGIPSPPAIYDSRTGVSGTPSLSDAERLQGFDVGWTAIGSHGEEFRAGDRWRMLGNAVSVPLSGWLGHEIANPMPWKPRHPVERIGSGPLPICARGERGVWEAIRCSTHVAVSAHTPLRRFLLEPMKPLSPKALAGYIRRVETGDKRLPPQFVRDLKRQLKACVPC